jgi:glycosyltransferase involved in cell wall biosynthesis
MRQPVALAKALVEMRFSLKRRRPSIITLADRARDAGHWELAAQLYRKALDRDPRNPPIWVQYGHALKESGELRDPDKLAQAEIAYRRALSLDPGIADSHLQLGHVLKIQGKKEEALSVYLQAIALGCSFDSAALELAQFGWSKADFSELRDMLSMDVVEIADPNLVGRSWPATSYGPGQDVGLRLPDSSPGDTETVEGNEAISHSDIADLRAQGLSVSEPNDVVAPQPHDGVLNDREIISPEFDRAYYLRTYPDINPSIVDPLDHFCLSGWREGRDPCDWFSTTFYLDFHSDVAHAGINPFVHYLYWGRAEGRHIAVAKARDLEIDPTASLVSEEAMLDILKFPSRPIMTKETTFAPEMMDIHWVIPDYHIGLGGHMTIFRIVRWLEIFGHHCTIWVNHPAIHSDSSSAFEDIIKHYQPVRSKVRFLAEGFLDASGDAVIATGWPTVQIVSHAQNFKERFYFVQDYEPDFYARGTLAILAELTYKKDFACLCCGTWLERIMQERYGRWARHFWLAADESIYFPPSQPRPPNRVPRIAFYGRTGASHFRRAAELGLLGLQHLASQGVLFHVDLYGSQLDVCRAPFSCTVHGNLSSEELANLYRGADLGLCFSTTNYSIVPQEMMACGLPVVEIDVESTRAIFPDDVVTFCGLQPLEIADAIGTLLADSDRRRRQAEAARAWVSSFSWEKSARLVEGALCDRLSERGYKPRSCVMTSPRMLKIKASVFIPTYNGGEVFRLVIDMLRRQRSPWRYEIVVIDSSSTDGTGDFCHVASDIVYKQIAQSEFSHGGTRNRGVEFAHGEFIAFLTQDALPIDEFWLYNLVSFLEAHPNAAGAFGRHVAWPNASPFTRRDLAEWFKRFDASPIAVSKETDPRRWASGDADWRRFLHFYSNNNSCLRRSVWEKFPLPNVNFGEDQLWASQVIGAGYEKIYAHAAAVYHSHDYDYDATAKRAEEEVIFFKLNFGYDLIDPKQGFEVTLASWNESDTRWAIQHGIGEPDLRKRLYLNKARLHGFLSGYGKCPT